MGSLLVVMLAFSACSGSAAEENRAADLSSTTMSQVMSTSTMTTVPATTTTITTITTTTTTTTTTVPVEAAVPMIADPRGNYGGGDYIVAVLRDDGVVVPYGFPDGIPFPESAVTEYCEGFPGMGFFVGLKTELDKEEAARFYDEALADSLLWDFMRLTSTDPLPGYQGDWRENEEEDSLVTRITGDVEVEIAVSDNWAKVFKVLQEEWTLADAVAALPYWMPLPDVPSNSVTIYQGTVETTWNGTETSVEDIVAELEAAGWTETDDGIPTVGFTEYQGSIGIWDIDVFDFGDGKFVVIYDTRSVYWPHGP
jgi:hypothetical protein